MRDPVAPLLTRAVALLSLGMASGSVAQMTDHASHADMVAPKSPQILEGYGGGGFPITTTNSQAQRFFDNGMQLAHAFAHKAAVAAMQEAERLDPSCAMCVWGEAWADGPTINFGKSTDEVGHLAELAAKARHLARTQGTKRERELTKALAARYRDGGGNKPGDLAFAKAMSKLVERYPDDDEIATMAADAQLMVPGGGMPDGDAAEARRAMQLLEAVLKRNPNYTPAIHFYIHATEWAGEPALAERFADRLAALAPKASHLVHMPSHTYYWVGRYEDAAQTNVKAVEIGIEQAKTLGVAMPEGMWGLPYHVHNITFGIGGALMAGDSEAAMKLAAPLVIAATGRAGDSNFRQIVASQGYFAFAHFADSAVALALPEPQQQIVKGAWHYMRGEVLARSNKPSDVVAEANAIPLLPADAKADNGSLQAARLLQIERLVLEGRAAMLQHEAADAAAKFERAAAIQEEKAFASVTDPPSFWYPVRRSVAEAKIAMGDAAGARTELQRSLELRPKDPVAQAMLDRLNR
jgi:tetratricopeptide (TPR) repeat protein